MVVINRTLKDSCENARVLLLLVRQSTVYSEAQRTRIVSWDCHVLRPHAH